MPYARKKNEASFQWDVCNAAYLNGWRITYEDSCVERPGNWRFKYHLTTWAGRTLSRIQDFLLSRRRGAFTLAYHTHDSRNSQKGFPDLVLVHPERSLLIFAELKQDGCYPQLEQRLWLSALSCVSDATDHVLTRLWRPSNWQDIINDLGGIDPRG